MTAGEKRLARAKLAAETLTKDKRKWLTEQICSYQGDSYLTRLHLLEGTPPRAYILENSERGICTVLDMEGQMFGEARGGDYTQDPVRWVPRARKTR
jgi:hypothetical protein